MKKILLISLLLFNLCAQATDTPGLLPEQVVLTLFEQDPAIASARASLDMARQESRILNKSPYEWNARLAGQRRAVQNDENYREWNIGVERTLRLPGKAAADRDIGQAIIEEFEARYGDALHETARDLVNLWIDWLYAESNHELANQNSQSSQNNFSAVQKRLRSGDAAKLDIRIAEAELADRQRLANDAQTQATVAWMRLHARFPGLDRRFPVMPTAMPVDQDEQFLRERILEQSDELKTAEAELRNAKAQAERIRADKIPDPTLGVYTGSEFGGRERIVGISISMPIPGSQRTDRATSALLNVEVKRQALERVRRQLQADIAGNIVTAQASYASLNMAQAGANAMQENARLMQRAYTLGEADLQALLSAQQQATNAAQNALTAQSAALKSFYLLQVDAHLVWGLDHERFVTAFTR